MHNIVSNEFNNMHYGVYCMHCLNDGTHSFPASCTTHVYLFSHRPSCTFHEDEWVKADHLQELGFLFGWNYYYDEYPMTEEEENLAQKMRAYWARFAKNGYSALSISHLKVDTHVKHTV